MFSARYLTCLNFQLPMKTRKDDRKCGDDNFHSARSIRCIGSKIYFKVFSTTFVMREM